MSHRSPSLAMIGNSSDFSSPPAATDSTMNATGFEEAIPVLPESWSRVLGVCYVVLFLVSFSGNGAILLAKLFTPTKNARKRGFLLMNLVLSDLLVSVILVAPMTLTVFLGNWWILGEFMCKLFGSGFYFSITASYVFMTLLALERYFVIRSSSQFTRGGMTCGDIWRNSYFLAGLAIVGWLFCFTSNTIFFQAYQLCCDREVTKYGITFQASMCMNYYEFPFDKYVPLDTPFEMTIFHTVSQFLIYYLIPVVINVTTYSLIVRQLNRAKRSDYLMGRSAESEINPRQSLRVQPSLNPQDEEDGDAEVAITPAATNSRTVEFERPSIKQRLERTLSKQATQSDVYQGNRSMRTRDKDRSNTVKMLVSVTACFALCNFPRHAANVVGLFDVMGRRFQAEEVALFLLVVLVNSAMNPIIIIWFSRSIRTEIRACFNLPYKATRERESGRAEPPLPMNHHAPAITKLSHISSKIERDNECNL